MDKIIKLRAEIKKNNLDGYYIPMSDEFFCEYVPEYSRRLEWLTGFTGSAGNCLVTKDKIIFETDGRYEIQAKQQLNSNYQILITPKNNIISWLENNIKSKKIIGFDPKLISLKTFEKFTQIAEKNHFEFKQISKNLIDEIWNSKPAQVIKPAFYLDKKISGITHKDKIAQIANNLKADYCLLTLSESTNWLLNIRGYDLPQTPFLLSFAIIDKNKNVTLYTEKNKISKNLKATLGKNIKIEEIKNIEADIKKLKNKSVQICPNNTSVYFYDLLNKSKVKIIHAADPCIMPKACKNKIEVDGIKQAHITDGAALAKFLYWLNNNSKSKNITEISLAEKLENIRKQNKNFFSLSFDTIAGFAENGAIIHYHANEKTNKKIIGNNLLLLDSGAQYFGQKTIGTTDVTRTIAVGKPTQEQKHNFTLVLKGHIALADAIFPRGTNGAQLDVLARKFLWSEEKDYAHGTGHGVGHFLNVHEGPQGISKYNTTPLEVGMVISNEPGYYKAGEYGIRIENLVVVIESKNPNYLQFETLTQAPIDLSLVDVNLLDKNEINWLNNYHKKVYDNIYKFLNPDEVKWLKTATKKL